MKTQWSPKNLRDFDLERVEGFSSFRGDRDPWCQQKPLWGAGFVHDLGQKIYLKPGLEESNNLRGDPIRISQTFKKYFEKNTKLLSTWPLNEELHATKKESSERGKHFFQEFLHLNLTCCDHLFFLGV